MTDLKDLLIQARPAVVHAHSGRIPCLAARLARIPAIVETRHGLPERSATAYRILPPARMWEAAKCALAHRTVAVCEADAVWLRQAGVARSRLSVVRNGVEPPGPDSSPEQRGRMRRTLGLPEHGSTLGYIGRLAAEKAPERFLETVKRIPDAIGVICGSGPEEAALRQRASELGIAARLVWLGARSDVDQVVPALDLLLLPSRREGLPYALLEALRAGVPVLCTPVGGMPEVLTGSPLCAGLLAWEPNAWAARARQFGTGSPPLAAWSAAARARAAEFPEERTVGSLVALYCELLTARGGRGLLPD